MQDTKTDTADDHRAKTSSHDEAQSAVTMSAADKKLDEVIKRLPVEVQSELIQMIRRDPRIARCLTESEGREKEITHAVRAGRIAGSTPVSAADNESSSLKNLKKNIQNMFALMLLRPRPPRPAVHPRDLPGVHPDFMAIAHGAYHNALVGVGHDHDEEHHGIQPLHHEEEHPHEPSAEEKDKEKENSPGYYHGGHAAAVLAGHHTKTHTH